jgi:uncharacterized protein (DUF924 family)
MMVSAAQRVLDFWFLPSQDPAHNTYRAVWFQKNVEFDDEIRNRFGQAVECALAGGRFAGGEGNKGLAKTHLANILLLDQFTRNIFRDTPKAFLGDAVARALAEELIISGKDRTLSPFMRWFAYLPFEHSETLADQVRGVALFTRLCDEAPSGHEKAFASALDYAKRHHEVIARFGRFPHRNVVLGRVSTEDERLFLQQPGSSF